MTKFCDEKCKYLNLTEKQQQRQKVYSKLILKHKCIKFKVNLTHKKGSSELLLCPQCIAEDINKEQNYLLNTIINRNYNTINRKRIALKRNNSLTCAQKDE